MDKKIFDISDKIKKDDEIQLVPQGDIEPKGEVNYWRSFKELYRDPEFIKAKKSEFTKEQLEKPDVSKMGGLSRRKFLALFSASAALAAAGCNDYRDKGEIIPYNKKPEEVTVGRPNFYASACAGCSAGCGTLIRTREGRPVKVDGNPEHPVNQGKICAIGQASIMSLYDPERLKEPTVKGSKAKWADVDDKILADLKNAKQIAVVANAITSPTFKKVMDEFVAAYPNTKIYSYEVFDNSTRKSAWQKCYGTRNMPVVKLEEAKIILALESDFLDTDEGHIENLRKFAYNRDVMSDREFNRLYAVEGAMTVTGMNADYRMRLKSDLIEEFVHCLISELLGKKKISNYATDGRLTPIFGRSILDDFAKKNNLDKKIVENLVNDLSKAQGESIVIAGDKMPESTHIAVNFLNEILGNTKLYSTEAQGFEVMALSSKDDMNALVNDMRSKKIDVVIHLDVNPAFNLAKNYKYDEALKNVNTRVAFSESANETTALCDYVLPVHTSFEGWGDYKTRTGVMTLQQPVVNPLYNTRQKEAVMLVWVSGKKESYRDTLYHEYLMDNWEKNVYTSIKPSIDFKRYWFAALQDGFVSYAEKPAANPAFITETFVNNARTNSTNDFVLLLQKHHSLGDGKHANNGWLQELPNPISKIVWDNYAAISIASAKELGVKDNDKIKITNGGLSLEVPVFIQAGLADKVISIELGGGRKTGGTIGTGNGFDTYSLMSAAGTSAFLYNNVKVEKGSGTYELVSTQEHHAVDDPVTKDIQYKRDIIREGTYEEYRKKPKFLQKDDEIHGIRLDSFPSINESTKEHPYYTGVKWAMVLDMNKCTGCNYCTIACNVENNIPVVGKDQVKVNREMHWIRIDRYYAGTPDAPRANFQPMLCQHCDNAPCENVCPVAATTHSTDGINGMAYNRCVGTRYCANNCPYKVRRFNYFNWRDRVGDGFYQTDPMNYMYNPEVTVRSRGVMEKCTFCLQRIMDAKGVASYEGRRVKGSDVKTACQEACPANAISFGDMNDKKSEFYQQRMHPLGYGVLEDIKVKPNVTYISKLRNILEPLGIEGMGEEKPGKDEKKEEKKH
ncbi:MAG: TAT-variant-translocated molybdopterin oxidoreductase [Bacteroidetes bacterium]|nr:TAT-variant-translocated molybdopterin oxidoreductase [Bacteroidota bacterium]